MGAWGTGSFENDDAADWVGKLGTLTPDGLTKVLVQAADDPAYLEATGRQRCGCRGRGGRGSEWFSGGRGALGDRRLGEEASGGVDSGT